MDDQRKKENQKSNAEFSKVVEKIVSQPQKPAMIVEVALDAEEAKALQKELNAMPGTFTAAPAYENEITAIGVILRQLAALPPDAQERALSYAASWVDDQKGDKEDET